MNLVEDVDEVLFDDDDNSWTDSDDEDDFGFGRQHFRDLVRVELMFMFQKKYWSRLWIIQELAVSPTTSIIHWGDSTFHLLTLQAVGDILLTHSAPRQTLNPQI
jgi:hypothetical protein